MLRATILRSALAVAFICIGGTSAFADAFTGALIANVKAEGESQLMTGVRGTCDEKSHIAVGPVGADLAQHRRPFRCDAAVIVFFDNQNHHVMINFAEKSATNQIIAFSGIMDAAGEAMTVQRTYFEPGKPTYLDDAACKFFFSKRHMTGIFCGGKIDADGQRTVASIVFNASPGQ